MNDFFRLKKFIQYQWSSKTKYYIHSPFVYQFYLNVLEGENSKELEAIAELRKQLRNDNSAIAITDFGTGKVANRTLAHIEKHVAVRTRYGKLLYNLVRYFKPQHILELGTSIGLSSTYLAMANAEAKIITLEGAEALAQVAKSNHHLLNIKNVKVITGQFDNTLPVQLEQLPTLDLVFFDGNHRKDATIKYFEQCLHKVSEQSIFVFDDIYWSSEMFEAWQQIKAHPQVTLTIDVFQFGICFFRKEKLAKEDFVLRY